MLRHRSIAFRLMTFFLLGSIGIGSILFFRFWWTFQDLAVDRFQQEARMTALAVVNRLDLVLTGIQRAAQVTGAAIARRTSDPEEQAALLRDLVERNPEVAGSGVVFHPGVLPSNQAGPTPLVSRRGTAIQVLQRTETGTEFLSQDWYRLSQEGGQPAWTEPFLEQGSERVLRCTYAVPLHNRLASGTAFLGVLTADLSLDWLEDFVSSLRVGGTGYVFLMSTRGSILAHPDHSLVMNAGILQLAETRNLPHLRTLAEDMLAGKSAFLRLPGLFLPDPCFVFSQPLSNGWSVGVVVPEAEVMAIILRGNRPYLVAGVIGLLAILFMGFLLARSFSRPLLGLTQAAEAVARRNLTEAARVVEELSGGEWARPLVGAFHPQSAAVNGKTDGPLSPAPEEGGNANEILRLLLAIDGMIRQLQSLLVQVGGAEGQVSASVSLLTQSFEQQEAIVNKVTHSSGEVITVCREIRTTADGLSATMNSLTQMSFDAKELASGGMTCLESLKQAMRDLLASNLNISEKFLEMRTRSDTVNQVIKTITKVASQINLLSLNASIEAEKAGEHGKGFTVVADETRKLAEQAACAVLDITEMIGDLQAAITDGERAVQSFSTHVSTSSVHLHGTNRDLGRIIDFTVQLQPQFELVNQRLDRQANNAAQINEAMEDLRRHAERNGEALRRSQEIVQSLAGAVQILHNEVARFSTAD